jgi:hypothetical protein
MRCGFEGEAEFPKIGVSLFVLGPGEPIGMYHWEHDQEDFLVLDGEALLLAVGARENSTGPDWGGYRVDDVARRHGLGVGRETSDVHEAYARFPEPTPARYRDGTLPAD